MVNLSPEFITRQIRVVLLFVAGIFVQRGYVTSGTVDWAIGVVMGGVTWAWSLYGNRIVARVNELVKVDNFIVIAPPEVANAVASPSAVSNEDVKVVVPPVVAPALKQENPQVQVEAGKT